MTKEDLLQEWLPRLWDALRDVRHNNNAAAEESLYELYVEMKQQTLAEKLETFSETTIEDQLSAALIELRNTQKRLSQVELVICQREYERGVVDGRQIQVQKEVERNMKAKGI